MNKLFFLLGTEFLLAWAEIWLGACGLPLPLAAFGAVYCALAFDVEYGIAGGVLAGMAHSIYFGGGWNLLLLVLYPAVAGGLKWWIASHEERRGWGIMLPGVLVALAAGIPALPGQFHLASVYGAPAMWRYLLLWAWSMAVSALLFPAVVMAGEAVNEFLGLPRFMTPAAKGRRL